MTHSSTIDHHVGISQGFHDAGAAVVSSDGKIVFAGHSERYSKNKNDPQLDCALMNEVRRSALGNIKINYYERSWLTNLRRFWTGQKLHNKVGLRASLKYAMLPIEHKSWGHHLSHAATAFQTSPFDSSGGYGTRRKYFSRVATCGWKRRLEHCDSFRKRRVSQISPDDWGPRGIDPEA